MNAIGKSESYIRISTDGKVWTGLPTPKFGSGGIEIETVVDGGRNANGDFIGQTVGKDKIKLNCSWSALSDSEFRALLRPFDREQGGSYIHYVEFYDPRYGCRMVRRMYVGDRKGDPFDVDPVTSRPRAWLNVQCNLVEV